MYLVEKGQITTKILYFDVSGENIPDLENDILKLVVVSRYYPDRVGVGLVHGLKLKRGAIASSVSHDSHNLIAAGTSDREIISAIESVVKHKGAMVVYDGKTTECLPLSLAGLMSELPYEDVNEKLSGLHSLAKKCGSVEDPFMYLSFLALTVIPEIRVTTKGIFDVAENSCVSLFI